MQRSWFLYLTTFICGMAVMAVELSASRLLAPFYGSSMITWTILIGVIMVALSLGNLLGGRLADRPGTEGTMFRLIWIASVWVAAIPFVGKYLIAASFVPLALIFPDSVLLAGTICTCLIIFATPCLLLGAVTPCLVKLGVTDMDRTGSVAGELYALSTVGSIIGTFVPTFVTIPTIGTSKTFLLFAVLLNLLADVHYLRRSLQPKRTAAVAFLLVALLLIPFHESFAFWKETVYEGESLYNYLQVSREGGGTSLSTHVEVGRQSISLPDHQISGSYWEYALVAPFLRPNVTWASPWSGLILGFGAGTFAKQARHFFPGAQLTGVEIDPGMIDMAQRFFEFTPQDARVVIDDGRAFLRRADAGLYDVIFLDAFQDVTIPFHMSTREFFQEVRNHLAPDGVLVININMRFEGHAGLLEYVSQTVRSVMPRVYRYDVPEGTSSMLYAPLAAGARECFARNLEPLDETHPMIPLLSNFRDGASELPEGALRLTDEVAPVEHLSQSVLDAVVRDGLRELFLAIFHSLRNI